jgi:hypothetical protein
MIEKTKTVYDIGDRTVRLLDPAHFSKYLSDTRENVSVSVKGDLRAYLRDHPEKATVIDGP